MAALAVKTLAGYRVKIWKTSFRVEGDHHLTHMDTHVTEHDIEQHILQNYPPRRKKENKPMTVSLNSVAFLVRDDVTTISASFGSGPKNYTFKATQKLASKLTVGDDVVVEVSHGIRVAQVVQIHSEPQIDPEDDINYQWAFQRVNTELLEELHDVESTVEDKLKERRKRSHRQQALSALGIDNPTEFFKELSLTHEQEE